MKAYEIDLKWLRSLSNSRLCYMIDGHQKDIKDGRLGVEIEDFFKAEIKVIKEILKSR